MLSALASTGFALMLGAGMAVAASGVFTSPDPVAITPSPVPVQPVELPRTQVTVVDALTAGSEASPPPSETVPREFPTRHGLRVPDVVALPDTGSVALCRPARDGEDGRDGECDALGGGWHSGHDHGDALGGEVARTGRGHGHDR